MNKIHRDGVDLKVAFTSAAKRVRDKDRHDGELAQQAAFSPNAMPAAASNVVPVSGARQRIKAILRLPARMAYRLLRPFIRPVAFRLRAYLLDGLRADMVDLRGEFLGLQRDHLGLQRELLESSTMMRHEILRLNAETQNARNYFKSEQMEAAAGVIQELKATRDFLSAGTLEATSNVARELVASMEAKLLQDAKRVDTSSISAQLDRIELYAYTTARRFAVNCGNDEILVRTEAGYVMCLGSDTAVLAALVASGDLERGTRLLIQRLLKPGDIFIDAGANLGLHTLAAAGAMQGRGKIIAFEPFAQTARLLEESVLINGFSDMVEVHQAAISTALGTRPLYLGKVSGHHSLFPQHSSDGRVLAASQIEVPLVRVDDIVGDLQPVALIKIDVEGAELEVLATADGVIRRNPDVAVIAEFAPSHLRNIDCEASQWLDAFAAFGFEWRAINAETGALEEWSLERLKSVYSVNLLFARSGSPIFSV